MCYPSILYCSVDWYSGTLIYFVSTGVHGLGGFGKRQFWYRWITMNIGRMFDDSAWTFIRVCQNWGKDATDVHTRDGRSLDSEYDVCRQIAWISELFCMWFGLDCRCWQCINSHLYPCFMEGNFAQDFNPKCFRHQNSITRTNRRYGKPENRGWTAIYQMNWLGSLTRKSILNLPYSSLVLLTIRIINFLQQRGHMLHHHRICFMYNYIIFLTSFPLE